jgi:hypothetical protein
MSVLREFRCTAHDYEFESLEENPTCPYGCDPHFVVVEFRTPFSIGTQKGRTVDRLQRELAADYGLTDMRNDRDSSVMAQTRRQSGGSRVIGSGSVRNEYREEQLPRWAPGIFRPPQGWAKNNDPPPQFDWKDSGLNGGPVTAAKPQLEIAKGCLKRQTIIEKRWDGK